ncbi:MAG: type II secretion system protein [bacterium]|nr:type II secretion system protein [bacterium]
MKLISQKGFTMIETLVGATLMIVVLTLISVVFLDSIVSQRKVIAFEQASSNARIIMDTLSREIRASTICGNTGGVRFCTDNGNNSPADTYSKELDIIRSSDNKPISYCIKEYPVAIPFPFANLHRLVNDIDFTQDPCDDTNPNVQILNGQEVALLTDDSGFLIRGVGQPPLGSACPGTAFDLCQPRATIVLHVQSITQKDFKERQDVRVQTTISQRYIDVP